MSKSVTTAFWSNVLICVIKTAVAFVTGSVGLRAEAIHSAADSINQTLLMHGDRRSKKKADALHPFGYGKEQYFWSFVVAMLLFTGGSVYSLYEGIHKILHKSQPEYLWLGLIVLGVSFVIEGNSWWVARKEIGGTTSDLFDEVIESKDSSTVVVFVEDTGALLGLGVAFLGTILTMVTGNPVYDAISSVVIGVLLFVMAVFLANEMKKLMVGESIDAVYVRYIRRAIKQFKQVKVVGKIKTMQLGIDSCIVAVDVDFIDSMNDFEMESVMTDIKAKIRSVLPIKEVQIYIQLQKLT